jgi:uncharacterized DUF497 family protein
MPTQAFSGFDWDDGNARKNEKHGVSQGEVEEVFLNQPLFVTRDDQHSQGEERFLALGVNHGGRLLHITFTMRGDGQKVRPISARPMSMNERVIYEEGS